VRIQVRFYSLFRERAGTREDALDVAPGATLEQALSAVRLRHPALGEFLDARPGMLLVSVNREYAEPARALRDGDEVALFPPVSGGADARGVLLLSGGFDSPVAARWALNEGYALDAVHFSMEPFTDDASARKATELARLLGLPRLTVLPIGPQLAEFARACDPRCYFVLQKRLMFRLADALADRTGAGFLLTGENLGQVSSQTLDNLGAIDAVARRPVMRPLLGLDKAEIIVAAREIGTFEASKGPEVCDVLGPKHPSTRVGPARVLREEAKVDIDGLVQGALASAFEVDPRAGYEAPRAAGDAAPPNAPC
jgi:thiamine biosynthesis protein ThiI